MTVVEDLFFTTNGSFSALLSDNVKLFTILREPVSQIRSSYNYLDWKRRVGSYSGYLKREVGKCFLE